jgi:pimeloyl-ACP methyl ester carboxylesterase
MRWRRRLGHVGHLASGGLVIAVFCAVRVSADATATPPVARVVDAAQRVYETTRRVGTVAYVERRGVVPLDQEGRAVTKRYVLRRPVERDQWNGVLVIGAHGGSGGNNYARDGTVIGTDETALDDVVGLHAVERGFAYASVDRDGVGGTREGLRLTYAFTAWAERQLEATGWPVANRYLVGLSMGGAIGRYAAEDDARRFAGVLLIAGDAGDPAARRERQAEMAKRWPEIDPGVHPAIADDDPRVAEYARVIGTPVAARALWPFTSAGAVRAAAAAPAPTPAPGAPAADDTSGRLRVPTIEVVGTWDDFVLPELLAYRAKVNSASQEAGRSLYRLYQVEGVWHVSGDDDGVQSFQFLATKMGLPPSAADAMGRGPSYLPTVRRAFAQLHDWVRAGVSPAADQTVAPGEGAR